METKPLPKYPPQPRSNSYRAEDIVAEFGSLAQFMEAMGPKSPLEIPELKFTDAENQRMDQLLAEENAASSSL